MGPKPKGELRSSRRKDVVDCGECNEESRGDEEGCKERNERELESNCLK